MHYFVTGSAGFIGSHLVKALESAGHTVSGLDVKDGSGDIQARDELLEKIDSADGIFHLAAIASVQQTIENPEATFATNVTGTRNIFEIAREKNIPVVYASSAAVYGDNQNLPLSENETPLPLSPYAEHKWQNEKDAATLGQTSGLKSFGVRFFNIYGPGQDPSSPYSGVISIFYDRLSAKKPITIFGDGKQTRDFVAVADAVQALIRAMDHTSEAAPLANVCTGRQTTLLELVDTLGAIFNVSPEIHFEEARAGDIRHSCGDSSKLTKRCGFKPALSLQEGLKHYVEGE